MRASEPGSAPPVRMTGTQRLAAALRDRIFAGEFQAGSALREEELAAQFHVSRHAIREALRMLVADGIAEYSSFKGVRVPRVSAQDVREIYAARRVVECSAVERNGQVADVGAFNSIHQDFVEAIAAGDWQMAFDADVAFHSAFVGLGGSTRLVDCHRELMQGLRLAHLVAPAFRIDGLKQSVREHLAVMDALAANQPRHAAKLLEQHLDSSECLMLTEMGSQQERMKEDV